MNIYTCKTFKGHWPVGTSAVIVADNLDEAYTLLSKKLLLIGLEPATEDDEFETLDTTKKHCVILQDGNY